MLPVAHTVPHPAWEVLRPLHTPSHTPFLVLNSLLLRLATGLGLMDNLDKMSRLMEREDLEEHAEFFRCEWCG